MFREAPGNEAAADARIARRHELALQPFAIAIAAAHQAKAAGPAHRRGKLAVRDHIHRREQHRMFDAEQRGDAGGDRHDKRSRGARRWHGLVAAAITRTKSGRAERPHGGRGRERSSAAIQRAHGPLVPVLMAGRRARADVGKAPGRNVAALIRHHSAAVRERPEVQIDQPEREAGRSRGHARDRECRVLVRAVPNARPGKIERHRGRAGRDNARRTSRKNHCDEMTSHGAPFPEHRVPIHSSRFLSQRPARVDRPRCLAALRTHT